MAGNLDRDNLIIENVLLARPGKASGHNISVESAELKGFADKVNSDMGGVLTCYMGHNENRLGTKLGKFKNIRYASDELRADLHLLASADSSPRYPGQATYVMNSVAEDPTALMMSIVAYRQGFYQKNNDGSTFEFTKIRYADPSLGDVYYKLGDPVSCDVEDKGALTNAMFSSDAKGVQSLLEQGIQYFKSFFMENNTQAEAQEDKPSEQVEMQQVTELLQQLSESMAEFNTKWANLQNTMSSINERIDALENSPAAEPTGGRVEASEVDGAQPIWAKSPTMLAAQAQFSKNKISNK